MNGESIGDGVSGSFGMPKEPLTPSPMPPRGTAIVYSKEERMQEKICLTF